DWPGNVRELKNAIERSIYRSTDPDAPVARIELDPFASPFRIEPAAEAAPPVHAAVAMQRTTRTLPMDLKKAVDAFERECVEAALAHARYNQRAAARLLGLSYHQLRACLRRHRVAPTREGPAGLD